MFIKFLSESYRSKKNRPLSFIINFVGMTLALTAVIVIYQHVATELNHDKDTFTQDMSQVVRTEMGDPVMGSITPAALSYFVGEMPEVEASCQLMNWEQTISTEGLTRNNIMKLKLMIVDSSVFKVLPFHFAVGDPQTALDGPNDVAITRSAAMKLFGSEDVIGHSILIDRRIPVQITAILEDMPLNSSYSAEVICNRLILPQLWGMDKKYLTTWSTWNCDAFARLKEGVNVQDFIKKYAAVVDTKLREVREMAPDEAMSSTPIARTFDECYFESSLRYTHANTTDREMLDIMIILAILILSIAIINYVNIYTARSSEVIHAMGIKAIFGAHKRALIGYIIGDAIFTTFLSALTAYALAVGLEPLYADILGNELSMSLDLSSILLLFVAIPVVVGVLAGFYPAFALTRQKPLDAISKRAGSTTFNYVRNTLIVLQFSISIALIASTIYINQQMNFVSNTNLGIDRDNVVWVTGGTYLHSKYETLRDQLEANPSILDVSRVKESPINIGEFATESYGPGDDDQVAATVMFGDDRTLELLGIKLIEGEMPNYLSLREGVNGRPTMLINETFASIIRTALGDSTITFPYKEYAGVISDFQHKSITEAPGPLVFRDLVVGRNHHFASLIIKVNGANLDGALSHIESTFRNMFPDELYEFNFLDSQFDDLYKSDKLLRTQLLSFSILAIIIGCLGLFALVSYSVERRRKEIAIRKVHGATISEMLIMLSLSFLKWLLISFVIATPVVWYAMNEWVSQYTIQAELGWWIFAVSGLLTTIVALITVITQSYLAATANPAKAIKSE